MSSDRTPIQSRPKFKFSVNEDILLRGLVYKFGENNWSRVAAEMHNRNPRQCRERWLNYLSPNIKSVPWTDREDALLLDKVREQGSQWRRIAQFFPLRTDINIKNRYRMLARKKEKEMSQEDLERGIRDAIVTETDRQTVPFPFSVQSLLNR
jgi:hypothetical protein